MKVYVATKWEEKGRAREVMDQLEAAGHSITYDWTTSEQFSSEQARLDLYGVMTADALVFLAEQDLNYRGAYVELGVALATGIPVIVVGRAIDRCLFVTLPTVRRVHSVDDVLPALDRAIAA
jgi:nucleoside 2-deoxyribosyltransferase